MTRVIHLWLAGVVVALVVTSAVSAQNASAQTPSATPANPAEPSLGNFARNIRKDKKQQAAKRFDNDNLPIADKLSVVGTEGGASADALAASDQSQANAGPQVTPGQSQEDRQKVYDQWKDRLSGQQSEVDLLARELDVAQREYRLRAATMYGDAGARLRNEAAWDKEDAEYKQKLAEKQKALDEAKQKMTDLQEDARKSGVPSSVRDGDQQ